jgi:hypothetical protein
MLIDVEKYEAHATIDATFALNASDDGRNSRQKPSATITAS